MLFGTINYRGATQIDLKSPLNAYNHTLCIFTGALPVDCYLRKSAFVRPQKSIRLNAFYRNHTACDSL